MTMMIAVRELRLIRMAIPAASAKGRGDDR
jgi:hypothetical protein